MFPGFNGSAVIFAALTVILVNAVKMLSRLKGFFFPVSLKLFVVYRTCENFELCNVLKM